MRLSRPTKTCFTTWPANGKPACLGSETVKPGCRPWRGQGTGNRELTPEQRDAYLALGEDLQRVWSHESTLPQLRKRLLRAVLVEIIATIKGREIHLLLHWKGGDHSHLVVPRNRTGEHRWTTDAQTGALIRDLARMLPDELIAGALNRLGKKTGKGNSWTKTEKSNCTNVRLSPSTSDSVHF